LSFYKDAIFNTYRSNSVQECGGLNLAGCQVPTQLFSPLLSRTGRENTMKMLRGQDKDREIAHRLPPWAKQSQLWED